MTRSSPDTERVAFIRAYPHLDMTEIPDAWGGPTFKHSHVQALWDGWFARATLRDDAQETRTPFEIIPRASWPASPSAAPDQMPTVEELAIAMWQNTHDGRWDDPYCNDKYTKAIYLGDAEIALKLMGRSFTSPSAAPSQTVFSPGDPVEIRIKNDAIDEIVIRRGDVHIEQMSADGWFMGVDACDRSYWQFWFGAKNRKSHVEFRHTETVPAKENAEHVASEPQTAKVPRADSTLYVERSAVRGILIGHNAATQAVLSKIDALTIFTAADFAAQHTQCSEGMVDALKEAERFMAYFSGETDGVFAGSGTPTKCLEQIRAELSRPKSSEGIEPVRDLLKRLRDYLDINRRPGNDLGPKFSAEITAALSLSRPHGGIGCEHDWKIWPETDGQSQRCMKCGAYRDTPSMVTSQHHSTTGE